jgi:hypothetical protein
VWLSQLIGLVLVRLAEDVIEDMAAVVDDMVDPEEHKAREVEALSALAAVSKTVSQEAAKPGEIAPVSAASVSPMSSEGAKNAGLPDAPAVLRSMRSQVRILSGALT